MQNTFQQIIDKLFCRQDGFILQANNLFSDNKTPVANRLNSAFLICLSGEGNPLYHEAQNALNQQHNEEPVNHLAAFYKKCLGHIQHEISDKAKQSRDFAETLTKLNDYLSGSPVATVEEFHDQVWSLFFPEAAGVLSNKEERVKNLRKARTVTINNKNQTPVTNPAKELLFTSNVLLTVPSHNTDIDQLPYTEDLKKKLKTTVKEPQLYWFDHPIPIGIKPEANEIIYGLTQLDQSLAKEKELGNMHVDKATCLLSVSVTHKGLLNIAKDYIQQELAQNITLDNLEVYIFTENETRSLLEHVFMPVCKSLFNEADPEKHLRVFGVDGEYGRHYSFLKAISAIWNVFIDNTVSGTFKIDLDQVFPQKHLVNETGKSALEHFQTPLWGATGVDNNGNKVELGMIAGALVNEKDIHKGLFTPDVKFPGGVPDKEANVFFSHLLMALSTEGELMTRYRENTPIDGQETCIQRIHVTGGTNGILINALRKHRPFTPSFVGRAEDQCYILSVLNSGISPRLAYLHEDGLIMRHDKEAFAQDAIKAAKFGNLVGDYIRILYFSEYAKTLTDDVQELKNLINPFTGCFVSNIPVTVCMMRFAIKGAGFFETSEHELGRRFFVENVSRLQHAIDFIAGTPSQLKQQVETERKGWNLFYDVLDHIEIALTQQNEAAILMQQKTKEIIDHTKICIE
jgi:hypothetical protein